MVLNRDQMDQLENAAALAFLGNPSRFDSGNGFRVQNSKKGQMCAVYWDALHPGNDVEIAFPPALLAGAYSGGVVQGWVQWQKERQGRKCNVHKHGSDWPILGFAYEQVHAFLTQVKLVRKGHLPEEVLTQIAQHLSMRTPQQVDAHRLEALLESLRPTEAHAVIDLVHRAGISVQGWFVKRDGTPAVSPRSNAAYCFNWAFGGVNEPSLASIWHKSLRIVDGQIEMRASIRKLALRLESIATDKTQDRAVRDTARTQAARARQLDHLLVSTFNEAKPLRVIINVGDMLDESTLGHGSSVVRVRMLDEAHWAVVSYNGDTGDCILRRGDVGSALPVARQDQPDQFADQYDLAGADRAPEHDAFRKVRARDPEVRRCVLLRSQGNCELCNTPGFQLPGGRLYAETHHVVPLSDNGADRVWNVVSLCPGHHREVHYGVKAMELRSRLVDFLKEMYPDKADVIGLPASSDETPAPLS